MEHLHEFIANLSEENLKKVPVTSYGIKKVTAVEMKLVKNNINRTKQYICGPYYKPITQIIDLAILRLKNNEKD
jgi:hypothetical protein